MEGDNWLTEIKTLAEFQKLCPQFEAHSQVVTSSLRDLFKSPELSRYELVQGLAGPASTVPLPAEIHQLLGWPEQGPYAPGAFPQRP